MTQVLGKLQIKNAIKKECRNSRSININLKGWFILQHENLNELQILKIKIKTEIQGAQQHLWNKKQLSFQIEDPSPGLRKKENKLVQITEECGRAFSVIIQPIN